QTCALPIYSSPPAAPTDTGLARGRTLTAHVDDAEGVAVRVGEDDEVRVRRVQVPVDPGRPEADQALDRRLLLGGGVHQQVEMDARMPLHGRLAAHQAQRGPRAVGVLQRPPGRRSPTGRVPSGRASPPAATRRRRRAPVRPRRSRRRRPSARPTTRSPPCAGGWDLHVEFGVTNPALYSLIYGDARPGAETPAARRASAILARHTRRIAEAGRLRV